MIVSSRGSVFNLLRWQWKSVLLYAFFGLVPPVLVHFFDLGKSLHLPAMPLTVVGAALGIFVSFRTNSSYDRWWEGRKLWGRMINTSRHFATQVLSYVSDREVATRVVRRHCAYVHHLRCNLRGEDTFKDPGFQRTIPEDDPALPSQSNVSHALLHKQTEDLIALDNKNELSEFRMQLMDKSIEKLLDIQGGCERIKKTPLPRGYGFIAEILIVAFSALFPYAVYHELGWLTVPANVLVCLAFSLISEVGRVLEDPFSTFYNGLPLSNISHMIEHNLMQRVGVSDEELPDIPGPINGILM